MHGAPVGEAAVPLSERRRQLIGQQGSAQRGPHARRAYFPEVGGFIEAAVVNRYSMKPGERVAGPALIEEREATTVLLPGDTASLTANGHVVIDISGVQA